LLNLRLIFIEYALPNADMRGVFLAPKNYNKNLIIVHHRKQVYEDKWDSAGNKKSIALPGVFKWDGHKELDRFMDLICATKKISNGAEGKEITLRLPE